MAIAVPELQSATVKPLRRKRATDDVVLYGVTGLLLFCPLAFGAVEPWAMFALELTSLALFCIWVFSKLKEGPAHIHWSPLFYPSLALVGVIVTQIVTGITKYRNATLSELLLYTAYGMICFLVVQYLFHTRQIRRIATVLGFYGCALAMFAVLQGLSSPEKLYWFRVPRFGGWIYGPYVNHNHYAGLMEMLFPIPLVFAFTRFAHGRERWLGAGGAALMGATIFLSNSRGGMIAFAVQIGIFLWILLKRRNSHQGGIAMGAFLIMSLILVAWLGWGQVVERVSTVSNHHSEITTDLRLDIDRDTVRMFVQRPVLGWGLGTFGEIYPQFRSFYTDLLIDRAHNDYLQLLCETGLFGFAIAIWFLVATLQPAMRKIKNWASDLNGAVALAATIGICGILVHSFVDFNLHIPANAALFYVLCTIAALEPRFRSYHRGRRGSTDAELDVAAVPQPGF